MSQRAVEALLGRLITDATFRRWFHQEPTAACQAEAFEVTSRELDALLALQGARIDDFAKLLDPRIVRVAITRERQTADSLARGARQLSSARLSTAK